MQTEPESGHKHMAAPCTGSLLPKGTEKLSRLNIFNKFEPECGKPGPSYDPRKFDNWFSFFGNWKIAKSDF